MPKQPAARDRVEATIAAAAPPALSGWIDFQGAAEARTSTDPQGHTAVHLRVGAMVMVIGLREAAELVAALHAALEEAERLVGEITF